MILEKLFNTPVNSSMKKVLDLTVQSQKVIAHNIANVETPGYIARELVFEDALKDAIQSKNPERILAVTGEIRNNYTHAFRMDGNNVNLESELIKLDEVKMTYDLFTAMLKKKLKSWRDIFEGVK